MDLRCLYSEVVKEEFKLEPNGTIIIALGGEESYTLRRPKIGEFRKFTERLRTLQAFIKELEDPNDFAAMEQYVDWFREVIEALSGQTVEITTEDAPLWLTDQQMIADMIGHWRTRPLAPGRRETVPQLPTT